MDFSDIPFKCKPECPYPPQCLVSLARKALKEIQDARIRGLGNNVEFRISFRYSIGGGHFSIDFEPETENPAGSKEKTTHSYHQLFSGVRLGMVNFSIRITDGKGCGGSTGNCYCLSPREDDSRLTKEHPPMDVRSYLKKQAGL